MGKVSWAPRVDLFSLEEDKALLAFEDLGLLLCFLGKEVRCLADVGGPPDSSQDWTALFAASLSDLALVEERLSYCRGGPGSIPGVGDGSHDLALN